MAKCKGGLGLIASALIGAGTCQVCAVMAQDPEAGVVTARHFRVVEGGDLLWEVKPSRGGAEMTFWCQGKRVAQIGADGSKSYLNLLRPDGQDLQSFVVTEEVVSHAMISDDRHNFRDIIKTDGGWQVRSVLALDEHRREDVLAEASGDIGLGRSEMVLASGKSEVRIVANRVEIEAEAKTGSRGDALSALLSRAGTYILKLVPREEQPKEFEWKTVERR